MIKSMTGFGAAEGEVQGLRARLEIKSLNNRFREFLFRTPHSLGALEDPLKKLIGSQIQRGRVELWIQLEPSAGNTSLVNTSSARSVKADLERLASDLGLPDRVTLSDLLRLERLFTSHETASLEGKDMALVWRDLRLLASEALDQLVKMRSTEGESLHKDLWSRLDTLDSDMAELKAAAAAAPLAATRRYQARMEELAGNAIDPERLAQEAAILAEKADITEEITRFETHVRSFRALLGESEPTGRRMEFLLQELLREANTMGSKSQTLPVTDTVLSFKSELEKIREQVLNIE
jgi:uncharacterized protein (TIGR00255 family)